RKVNDEYDKQTIGSDKVECREDFNMVDVEHVDDAHVTEAELRHNFWQGH
ncbi:hypothetical protein Tco_0718111, partial [Tanacetum coccineum]